MLHRDFWKTLSDHLLKRMKILSPIVIVCLKRPSLTKEHLIVKGRLVSPIETALSIKKFRRYSQIVAVADICALFPAVRALAWSWLLLLLGAAVLVEATWVERASANWATSTRNLLQDVIRDWARRLPRHSLNAASIGNTVIIMASRDFTRTKTMR